MLIVQVHVQVKPGFADAFKEASLKNARASVQEPGIARFDVLQNQENPNEFLLTEVYRNPDAPAAHKQTEHYETWRKTVEPMMAAPRQSSKFSNVFPDDSQW